MKSENKFIQVIIKLIMILFTFIIGYLLLSSIFSTAYIGNMEYPINSGIRETTIEHTYFVRDYWWLHFLIFAGISIVIYMLKERNILSLKKCKKLYIVSIVLYVIVSSLIIIVGKVAPRFDQKHCLEIAQQFKNNDFSQLSPGGYLFIYPFQIGLVIANEVLGYLFGDGNFLALQILNVILSLIIFIIINRQQKQGIILSVIFVPWILTNTLVYGTVPGLALCAVAVFLVNYRQNGKMGYICMGLSGILVAMAIALKSNYLIFAIAISVYILLGLIKKERKPISVLVFLLILIFSHIGISQFNENYLYKLNGGEVTGVPMSGYVAMGLQDGKLAPGWYNGYYMGVYENSGYDYEKSDEEFRKSIISTIKKDIGDLNTAISKYSKKIQSEWNNPTFQSVWLVQEGNLKCFTDGIGRCIYINFCNILQTIILAFTFIFAITRIRTCEVHELLFPIYFIGGFLFHLIWEAQCIYVTPYFICLLPLAVSGMLEWRKIIGDLNIGFLKNCNRCEENVVRNKPKTRELLVAIAVCTIVCIASFLDPFQKLIARCDDTKYYDTYNQPMYTEEQIANNG